MYSSAYGRTSSLIIQLSSHKNLAVREGERELSETVRDRHLGRLGDKKTVTERQRKDKEDRSDSRGQKSGVPI